ncbi:UNVERIFIED_CONTAM: hypothetical protein Scaly_2984000 [Sesamum calycinum]|uniref:Retrotransposon gag domain-containing protein n=1 Tax=Sesamum calycinum TaxID=2727403 RepID=A0AAW2KP81_9LAMI
MDSIENAPKPINVIFDGSNYDLWAQEICSFLKGRLLWRIVTGEIPKLSKKNGEDEEKFTDRLEKWDGKNHQILTWFRNTCANVVKLDFRRFDTQKRPGIFWHLITPSPTISQLYRRLHRMQQQPDQTIHTYISELQTLWDQLAICDPVWPNVEATKVYADLRDRQHVWHLLMTLRDEFESVQSSLLHRSPLPKLDIVIKDLISEEIRLNTLHAEHVPLSTDMVLATHATQTLPLMFKHLLVILRTNENPLRGCSAITSSYKAVVTTASIDESLENSSPKFSVQDIQALFQQLQPEHGLTDGGHTWDRA